MQSLGEKLLYTYARRFPVRTGKMRLVNSLWPHVVRSDDVMRTARLKMGGFEMQCDLRQHLQRQFYFYGTYWLEEEVLNCWRAFVKNAHTIFDVGANAGIFSLAALAVQPAARVHAFEPTPEIAARLRETAVLNKLESLRVHELAIARVTGSGLLNLCYGENGTNDGMNFVTDQAVADEVLPITTTSIDEFCAREGIHQIDCLKLDIQGNEGEALAGAARLLAERRIGAVLMELNWAERTAERCPATESIQILSSAGFLFAAAKANPVFRPAGDWMRALTEVVAKGPRLT